MLVLTFILVLLLFDVDGEWPRFVCGCKVPPATDIQLFSFSWFIVCDYSGGLWLKLSEALFVACRL